MNINQYFRYKINRFSTLFDHRIKVQDLRSGAKKNKIYSTSESEEVDIRTQSNYYYYGEQPSWLDFEAFTLPPAFKQTFKKCEIIGRGIVVNENKKVILECTIFQRHYLNKLYSNHLIYFRSFIPYQSLDKVVPLSNHLEKNYFHWILESLGRLVDMTKSEIQNFKYFIGPNPPDFIPQSLSYLFDINPNQLVIANKKRYKTKECLILSFPFMRSEKTKMHNVYSPKNLIKINSIAQGKAKKTQKRGENILLSRNLAHQRKILNEKEILQQLTEFNLKLVILEKLDFKDQVELFQNANIIIGTHGAGLTNIIFSKPSATIIEFFPKERPKRDAFYFFQISNALNIKHHVIEYTQFNEEQDFYCTPAHLKQLREILSNEGKLDIK